MLSIGSRNTVLANRTSGIQRPHTTWAQRPSSVCLKAPPRLGQRQHSTDREGLKYQINYFNLFFNPKKKHGINSIPLVLLVIYILTIFNISHSNDHLFANTYACCNKVLVVISYSTKKKPLKKIKDRQRESQLFITEVVGITTHLMLSQYFDVITEANSTLKEWAI